MFKIRTTPVIQGTQPYKWNTDSTYQCTWYSFYRALEVGYSPPCWYDRDTEFGSYTNAKDWLANYRDPWEVKGLDYTAQAGDIVVYDGTYGHVQFMETNTMYSEYANGNPESFKNGKLNEYYNKNILGYLHFPLEAVEPVERNTSVNQIQTTDAELRIRTKPSLNGEVVGYVQLGFYNVLDQKNADGYIWYKLAKDRWCANVSTIYLPSDETDIIKEIEQYFNSMKDKVNTLSNENTDLKDDMRKIDEISKRWL